MLPIKHLISTLTLITCGIWVTSNPSAANAMTVDEPMPLVVLVTGAPGTEEYGQAFDRWAESWVEAGAERGAEVIRIGPGRGLEDSGDDREALRKAIDQADPESSEPLWIVLIGHGTFDGRTARFNLRGPDLTADDLAAWLEPLQRPLVVIDCASASGPFLDRLSGEGRVVITATQSGDEINYARFGGYLAEALLDPEADLDKDEQVSILEAYLIAGARVAESYQAEARLATEHPLLDDNGDRRGTPPNWFRGVRAVKAAEDGAPVDGNAAHQIHLVLSARERELPTEVRRQRDRLEQEIAAIRERKPSLDEDAYYDQLEDLMLRLARLYRDGASVRDQDASGSD